MSDSAKRFEADPSSGGASHNSALSDALRRYAPLGVGAAIAAAAATGVVNVDLPAWAVKSLEQWGPAAALIMLMLWYVPRSSIQDFISAQQAQAVAMQKVGDQLQVMTGQAGKVDEILTRLEDIKFDSGVFADRLVRIEERLINGQRQNDL